MESKQNEDGNLGSMAEIKELFPAYIIGNLMVFLSHRDDFLSFFYLNKSINQYIRVKNPNCCRNIKFILRSNQTLEENKFYVFRLRVSPHFFGLQEKKYDYSNLKFFPNLIDVHFWDCGSRQLGEYVKYAKRLEVLSFDNCRQVSGQGLEKLGKVRRLRLVNCPEVHEGVVSFQSFPLLEVLEIKGCGGLTGRNFQYLKNLSALSISYNNKFRDELFKMKSMRKLQHLSLNNTGASVAGKYFEHLKSLKSFTLMNNKYISDKTFRKFFRSKCPLKRIRLEHCNNLTDEIFKYTPFIRDVCIRGPFKFILGRNNRNLKNVRKLTLCENMQFKDAYFLYFSDITTLNVWDCKKVENGGFRHLKNLRNISIFKTDSLTDSIFLHSKVIRKVGLEMCYKIDGSSFKGLRNLMQVRVVKCPKIDPEKLRKQLHANGQTTEVFDCFERARDSKNDVWTF